MEVFTQSLQNYIATFSLNKAVMIVIIIFLFVGGIDRILGNRLGYGEKFLEGFEALGSLGAAMIGMIALVPVIKIVLGGVLGAVLGESARVLRPVGMLFLNLVFVLVVPLVFFSLPS